MITAKAARQQTRYLINQKKEEIAFRERREAGINRVISEQCFRQAPQIFTTMIEPLIQRAIQRQEFKATFLAPDAYSEILMTALCRHLQDLGYFTKYLPGCSKKMIDISWAEELEIAVQV